MTPSGDRLDPAYPAFPGSLSVRCAPLYVCPIPISVLLSSGKRHVVPDSPCDSCCVVVWIAIGPIFRLKRDVCVCTNSTKMQDAMICILSNSCIGHLNPENQRYAREFLLVVSFCEEKWKEMRYDETKNTKMPWFPIDVINTIMESLFSFAVTAPMIHGLYAILCSEVFIRSCLV